MAKRLYLLITLVSTILLASPYPAPVASETDRIATADQPAQGALNCRYGLAAWEPELSAVRSDQWGTGWYLTFGATRTPVGDMEYMRMVRTRQDKAWDGTQWVFSDTVTITPPLTDDPGGLGALVQAYPGNWWAIGNEPDRGPNPGPDFAGQDGTYPDLYAQAYHDVYWFIRQRDPTAQIGPGGLVEVTPGRIQYLDLFVSAYEARYGTSVPVDFWTMHIYILPEAQVDGEPNGTANIALGTDPALAFRESGGQTASCHDMNNDVYCWADHDDLNEFALQVRRMRQWMKDRGWQDKPLWLTEFGILYPFEDYDDPVNPTHCYLMDEYGHCFTAARVTAWLQNTFAYLRGAIDPQIGNPTDNNHLVQRWAWYALALGQPELGYVSTIVEGQEPYTRTQVGDAFYGILTSAPQSTNLLAYRALPAIVRVDPTGPITATLRLEVVNNGDSSLPTPVLVTWYADISLTVPIGTTTLSGLPGCASHGVVTTTWAVGPGTWSYWVVVDSDNQLAESNEGDNTAQGTMGIQPSHIYLPLLER